MKLWIDDIRPAPKGYKWIRTVNDAINIITIFINDIELIDLDHDAGDYATEGGDYINILNWLEWKNYNFPIRIHSMNPVGVMNIRRIIQKNNWKEVF